MFEVSFALTVVGIDCIPFASYVNIVDYGAVADGVTDNSTAITNAIAAAKAAGKNVYVPPIGVFLFNSDITVDTVILFGWACEGLESQMTAGSSVADVTVTNGGSVQYLTVTLL